MVPSPHSVSRKPAGGAAEQAPAPSQTVHVAHLVEVPGQGVHTPTDAHVCGWQMPPLPHSASRKPAGGAAEQAPAPSQTVHLAHLVDAPGLGVHEPIDAQVLGEQVVPVPQTGSVSGITSQPPAPLQALQVPHRVLEPGRAVHVPKLAQVFGLQTSPEPHAASVRGVLLH